MGFSMRGCASAYRTSPDPPRFTIETQKFKATLNKSLLALFSGRESEVNSDSLPPNQSLA
jgi:hypothetical protein